ncbi:type II secretion system minor pseudopilin GspI [Fretibacter rubidus]|uniref:type II secretion system minor pseudopilin GspI n=1 Tax=Fretibacter rubidus TaxID=570162 RepID=UPI00352A0530
MKPSCKDQGFTLIEVLAALLVFTFAIIGLTHAGTQSAQGVSVLDEKMLGGIVADNVLITARRGVVQTGTMRGESTQMGREFAYIREISPVNDGGLFRITVDVRKKSAAEDGQVIISRTAFMRVKTGIGL